MCSGTTPNASWNIGALVIGILAPFLFYRTLLQQFTFHEFIQTIPLFRGRHSFTHSKGFLQQDVVYTFTLYHLSNTVLDFSAWIYRSDSVFTLGEYKRNRYHVFGTVGSTYVLGSGCVPVFHLYQWTGAEPVEEEISTMFTQRMPL